MREGKIISSRFWAKTLAVEGTRRKSRENNEISSNHLCVRNVRSVRHCVHLSNEENPQTSKKFVATEPLSDQVRILVSIVAENDSNPILVSSNKRKQRRATCENPEVATTLAVSRKSECFYRKGDWRLPDVTRKKLRKSRLRLRPRSHSSGLRRPR